MDEIKYFIEHKETGLWWFTKNNPDFSKDPSHNRFFIDGWTNDPNHFLIDFDTKEEAQYCIDNLGVQEPTENLIITEHEFVTTNKQD